MTADRRRALPALLLLVPAPTLGVLAAFVLWPGPVGRGIFFAAKLWILALPLLVHLGLERGRASLSPLPRGRRARSLAMGLGLGLIFGAVVLAVHASVGERWIDPAALREVLARAGFDTRSAYIAITLYVTFVNSLLEEYVWRWFVFRQAERLVGSAWAVPLAALCFTLHHSFVFTIQLGPEVGVLGSLAVFSAACTWSWLYARTRSIWPGWISHVIVDAVGLWIGWKLLF